MELEHQDWLLLWEEFFYNKVPTTELVEFLENCLND